MSHNSNYSDISFEEELENNPDSQLYTLDELKAACQEEGVSVSKFTRSGRKIPERKGTLFSTRKSSRKAVQLTCKKKIPDSDVGNFQAGESAECNTTVSQAEGSTDDDHSSSNVGSQAEAEDTDSSSHGKMDGTDDTDELTEGKGSCNHESGNKRRNSSTYESETRRENRIKRMRGETYMGFSTIKNAETGRTNTPQNIERAARQLGAPCKSASCFKTKSRKCNQFSEEARQSIFTEFWQIADWKAKQLYVRSLVDRSPTAKSTVPGDSKRSETFRFYLKLDGARKQVCRNMFLSTLSLTKDQVRSWMKTTAKVRIPRKPTTKGGNKEYAEQFLKNIPKLESHYCRKDTKKLYLEPIYRSKYQLFEKYKEKCSQEKTPVQPISKTTFNRLVKKMHIGIHQPKKDRCDLCASKDAGNCSDPAIKEHLEKKNSARAEKQRDKEAALRGDIHLITMDVQKVLLSPMLTASALYYKTKLVVHNFTVFDLATLHACCYLWDETESDLVASSFATCLVKYMEDNFEDKIPIVIFSDGATSQNRNAILSNALLNYAVRKGKCVTQKYLEKGHTQMEVDSVHSQIEKSLKGLEIHLPTDYIDVCKRSRRNPQPYEVVYMKHPDFKNYSVNKTYSSIRPEKRKNLEIQPNVTDLRQIRYNANGTMDYKLDHKDKWNVLCKGKPVDAGFTFPNLNTNGRLPITKRKYQDLLGLLHVIPPNCHEFYKSLPHKN